MFFQDVGDFEVDFTDDGDIEHLRVWIRGYQIKVLILYALLDHVGGAGTDEYKPRQVRAALAPLRRLAGEEEIAVLGSMHPRKGKAQTFRELMAASHQFNAVSRSSMLLAPHPEHDDRRVLALGKSNHAGRVSSLEFRVEVVHFELNGYQFRDVRAVDWCESAIDLDAAMQASMGTSGSKPSKVDLAGDAICEVLEDGPRPSADVKTDARRKVGCGHATIERAAAELREDGVIGSWGSSNRTVWFLRNQSSSPGESEDEEEDDQTDKSPVNMRDSGDSSSSSSSDPSPVEEVGSGERNGSVGADESARVTAAADLLRRIQEMDDQ